jgi:hypothetical protein
MSMTSPTQKVAWCRICKEMKPIDCFFKSQYLMEGRSVRCKKCDMEALKKYRAKSDKWKETAKWRRLQRLYGITKEDYLYFLEKQKGRCAICKRIDSGHSGTSEDMFHVDHCHKTGRVRGLLCYNYNIGIGYLRDDPSIMISAANYIREHNDNTNTTNIKVTKERRMDLSSSRKMDRASKKKNRPIRGDRHIGN